MLWAWLFWSPCHVTVVVFLWARFNLYLNFSTAHCSSPASLFRQISWANVKSLFMRFWMVVYNARKKLSQPSLEKISLISRSRHFEKKVSRAIITSANYQQFSSLTTKKLQLYPISTTFATLDPKKLSIRERCVRAVGKRNGYWIAGNSKAWGWKI